MPGHCTPVCGARTRTRCSPRRSLSWTPRRCRSGPGPSAPRGGTRRTGAECTSGRHAEDWGRAGYVNRAEADLLVDLATHYHRRGAEWAVIVPYRAQVDLISRRLDAIVGSSRTVELNV